MNILAKLASTVAVLSFTSYAAATPIPATQLVTDTAPYAFTFDMSSDPALSTMTSATLHFELTDIGTDNEQYNIFFGNNPLTAVTGTNINKTQATVLDITLDSTAFADLKADGKLLITLTAGLQGGNSTTADYYINGPTVTTVEAAQTNVPEPASLALFGIAMLGFGAARARKQ
jgi:hypothetical protein